MPVCSGHARAARFVVTTLEWRSWGTQPRVEMHEDVQFRRQPWAIGADHDVPMVLSKKVDQRPAIIDLREGPSIEACLKLFDFPAPIEPALRKLQLGFWGMKVPLDKTQVSIGISKVQCGL